MVPSTPTAALSPPHKPSPSARTSLTSSSVTPSSRPSIPGRADALEWKSVVRSHKLTLEHAAVDIDTDRVLYHMELEFETPLPSSALQHAQFLCLSFPYGGLWKIERVSDHNTKVKCLSWRKTDLTHREVEDLAKRVDTLATKVEVESTEAVVVVDADPPQSLQLLQPEPDSCNDAQPSPSSSGDQPLQAVQDDDLPTLFEWKMMRGEWGHDINHWFIRDVEPPALAIASPPKRRLVAKLFVGFAPLEARIEVNAVTAIDTIAQTYAADVTWQVTLPAITTLREDTVLLEFLDILEIDAHQFEFNNIKDMQSERDLTSSVTPAGEIHFRDLVVSDDHAKERGHVENVYHLQYSRRVIASFTEEMALHLFPFDQQKLIFEFTTGSCGMPDGSLQLIPTPVEPGCFSIDDFQLGNVFDVAYRNKIFVSEIKETGPRKSIAFEMVLERKSAYYVTNVALIAAIITYLCFVLTYAPVQTASDGNNDKLMETGTRLQNVTAMLLTAVTFKSQVAALLPQISYFTTLDSYVFFCFIVTALVAVENALFPLFVTWFSTVETGVVGQDVTYDESRLLGISFLLFTLVNIVWAVYLKWWLVRRRAAAQVLLQVHEYIRVITDAIPAKYREEVLHKYLEMQQLDTWCMPTFVVTSSGDIHIQAPDDRPAERRATTNARKTKLSEKQKSIAMKEETAFKKIYFDLRPSLDRHASAPISPAAYAVIPAARPSAAVYQAGTRLVTRMGSSSTLQTMGTHGGRGRTVSANAFHEDVVVNVESFRRMRAAAHHVTTSTTSTGTGSSSRSSTRRVV